MSEGRGVVNQGIEILRRLGVGVLVFGGLAQISSASVIRPKAEHFTTVGTAASFKYAPPSYSDAEHPNAFFYDIFYYIPERLKDQSQVKALVFNHGGGFGTLTRDNSLKTVRMYFTDLIAVADALGIVVVLPSANGLNWDGNMVGIMRDLAAMMRTELDVDPNKIALSGHSMGGMGITRNFDLLADQFSFFMPMSSGMDLSHVTEEQAEWKLNKVFNVPYLPIQGLQDKFKEFIIRCQDQETRTHALEVKYGAVSQLKMNYLYTDHEMQPEALKLYGAKAFANPRNLYQSELWGTLRTLDEWKNSNGLIYKEQSVPRYFWVEALHSDLSKREQFNFHAKIKDNSVYLELPVMPTQTHELRIYLSSKLLNLKQTVNVYVNQVKLAVRDPKVNASRSESFDSSDPGFIFDSFIDVKL